MFDGTLDYDINPFKNFTKKELSDIISKEKLGLISRIKSYQLQQFNLSNIGPNIGFKPDDLFKLVVFNSQDHADFMRNN